MLKHFFLKLEKNETIRLNQFIASCGICSRRKADELIVNGKIRVNEIIINKVGTKILQSDKVFFNGKEIRPQNYIYILMNKPKGFITTSSDEKNRKTVFDIIKNRISDRVFSVGRLDKNTTGLLILTNDGYLAKKLSHPSYDISKVYQVHLKHPISKKNLLKIKNGISLEDGNIKVDSINFLDNSLQKIGLELHSGKNRIIRRIFEYFKK